MVYGELARYEDALKHITVCLGMMDRRFDYLIIAARCSKELNNHEQAYEFSQRPLMTKWRPILPKFIRVLISVTAIIPRLSGIKNFSDMMVITYESEQEWLRKYIEWYEQEYTHGNLD